MAEKINKEALKHAEKYASNMTTVIKRAYYDGYLRGKKVNTVELRPTAIEPKLTNGKKKKTRQDKVLAYLEKHKYICVHDVMKVIKLDAKAASTLISLLMRKGFVESEIETSSCKKSKTLHKRYKLCTQKSA